MIQSSPNPCKHTYSQYTIISNYWFPSLDGDRVLWLGTVDAGGGNTIDTVGTLEAVGAIHTVRTVGLSGVMVNSDDPGVFIGVDEPARCGKLTGAQYREIVLLGKNLRQVGSLVHHLLVREAACHPGKCEILILTEALPIIVFVPRVGQHKPPAPGMTIQSPGFRAAFWIAEYMATPARWLLFRFLRTRFRRGYPSSQLTAKKGCCYFRWQFMRDRRDELCWCDDVF